MRTQNSLIPVEVKAKRGTAESLRTLIQSARYPDIGCGIKFTAENIGYRDGIYTFPYFCAFLLKEYLKKASLKNASGQEPQPRGDGKIQRKLYGREKSWYHRENVI